MWSANLLTDVSMCIFSASGNFGLMMTQEKQSGRYLKTILCGTNQFFTKLSRCLYLDLSVERTNQDSKASRKLCGHCISYCARWYDKILVIICVRQYDIKFDVYQIVQ